MHNLSAYSKRTLSWFWNRDGTRSSLFSSPPCFHWVCATKDNGVAIRAVVMDLVLLQTAELHSPLSLLTKCYEWMQGCTPRCYHWLHVMKDSRVALPAVMHWLHVMKDNGVALPAVMHWLHVMKDNGVALPAVIIDSMWWKTRSGTTRCYHWLSVMKDSGGAFPAVIIDSVLWSMKDISIALRSVILGFVLLMTQILCETGAIPYW